MSAIDSIVSGLTNTNPTSLSSVEQDLLNKIPAGPQRDAQEATLKLQHLSEMTQAITNMLKILHDMNMGIIQNMR
jgi:hypothetical protein